MTVTANTRGLPQAALGAFRAEPPTLISRLACRHLLNRAYRDKPVRSGSVERALSAPVPTPAMRNHTGRLKARIREPFPPRQLFRISADVVHAHTVSLR